MAEGQTTNIRDIIEQLKLERQVTNDRLFEVLVLTNVRIDSIVELFDMVTREMQAIRKETQDIVHVAIRTEVRSVIQHELTNGVRSIVEETMGAMMQDIRTIVREEIAKPPSPHT